MAHILPCSIDTRIVSDNKRIFCNMKYLKQLCASALFAITMVSTTASAGIIQYSDLETETVSGVPDMAGLFTFDAFDDELGELLGVRFWAELSISGGHLSVDNETNTELNGTGYLGASMLFGSPDVYFYNELWGPTIDRYQRIHFVDFNLAADPTESVGGNGPPDTGEYFGGDHVISSGWKDTGDIFLFSYLQSNLGKDTFDIAYEIDSQLYVGFDDGVSGSFEAVDAQVVMKKQFVFQTLEQPPTTRVSEPAPLFLLGVALIAIGYTSRRKRQQ